MLKNKLCERKDTMKKFLALILALVMALSLVACGGGNNDSKTEMKFGFIFLHDENSTYDLNFINAAKAAYDVDFFESRLVPESVEHIAKRFDGGLLKLNFRCSHVKRIRLVLIKIHKFLARVKISVLAVNKNKSARMLFIGRNLA